jgi:hypothetical protein
LTYAHRNLTQELVRTAAAPLTPLLPLAGNPLAE